MREANAEARRDRLTDRKRRPQLGKTTGDVDARTSAGIHLNKEIATSGHPWNRSSHRIS